MEYLYIATRVYRFYPLSCNCHDHFVPLLKLLDSKYARHEDFVAQLTLYDVDEGDFCVAHEDRELILEDTTLHGLDGNYEDGELVIGGSSLSTRRGLRVAVWPQKRVWD
jgi:hypothetical protein